MQATGTPRVFHRLRQHAEPAEVGDVQHDDVIGAPQLLHRLRGPIHAGEVLEQEAEAGRRGGRIGDGDIDAPGAEQVGEPGFAAQPVAVRIDVGGETHPLSRMERRGESSRRLEPIGRQMRTAFVEDNGGTAEAGTSEGPCRAEFELRPARSLASLGKKYTALVHLLRRYRRPAVPRSPTSPAIPLANGSSHTGSRSRGPAPSRRSAGPRCRPGDRASGTRMRRCRRAARTAPAAS